MQGCTMGITRLPVHLSGEDFVIEETDPRDTRPATEQIEAKISLLDRYFRRPASSVFDNLTYKQYYDLYSVAKAKEQQINAYERATAEERESGLSRSATSAKTRKVQRWWIDIDSEEAQHPIISSSGAASAVSFDRFVVSERRGLHGTRMWGGFLLFSRVVWLT